MAYTIWLFTEVVLMIDRASEHDSESNYGVITMKEEIHPEYRDVVFKDVSSGEKFVIGSTIETEKTTSVDGEEFPLYEVEVSSASHPFYTGEQKLVDSEGRVEKFKRKYGDPDSDESDE